MSVRRMLSAVTCAAACCATLPAAAEEDPNGRGVIGGALVGAELTLIGEALLGVEPTWAYFVGGGVGAGVGAYAGHLVEQNAEREASLILLAAGIGLVIPTAVLVGNATQPAPPPPESVRLLPPRLNFAAERVSLDLLRGQF